MTTSNLLRYDSPYPLYGISFSSSSSHPLRTALSTLVTGPSNKILIVDPSNQSSSSKAPYSPQVDFAPLASANLAFPATKIGWEPRTSLSSGGREDDGGRGELLATTGDVLRIWECRKEYADGAGGEYVGRNGYARGDQYSVTPRSVLTNSKAATTSLPPITSFSWNSVSPTSVVTCSIDTTATLWDINTSQAKTQLIAHDRAVYDLSWLPQSSDIFVSVGADGSLRAFDLRTLEHSTILYESAKETPLARIAFSNREQHMLACFGLDEQKVLILDMRSPGQPVAELLGHQAPVGAIAWGSGGDVMGSTGGGWIATCADDCQLLMYDLTSPLPESRPSTRPPTNRPSAPRGNASPNPYALSPPNTPSRDRNTPSPSQALDMMPSRGWTAEMEIGNLAFAHEGDYLGCVSGQRLNVLKV